MTTSSMDSLSINPSELQSPTGSAQNAEASVATRLRVRVYTEVGPLGHWMVEKLEQFGYQASFVYSPAMSYSIRRRPGVENQALAELNERLRPFLACEIIDDPDLADDFDLEIHLGGEPLDSIRVSIRSDSETKLQQVGSLVQSCGLCNTERKRAA